MNIKRFIMAVIAAFIFVGGFSYLWHEILLIDTYIDTADLWRPAEHMEDFMCFMFVSQFLMVAMLAFIFTRHYEGNGIGEGARYGLYMGALMAVMDLGSYAYLPIEFPLVAAWMMGDLITGFGVGVILAAVYRK